MVTITNKEISPDEQYVLITLSDGTEMAVQVDWSTKMVQESYEDEEGNLAYRDTEQSLLAYEIEQAVVRAEQRAAASAGSLSAAQEIIQEG